MNSEKRAADALQRIEWLLMKKMKGELPKKGGYVPPYGNLVELNMHRVLVESVGDDVLADIVGDYLDLLDTSAAVYERNGDYALGIFTSGWCQLLDRASRELCHTTDNKEALKSGKWHCHESCWGASKTSIETGQPVDIECSGGIHLYAVPIWAGGEIVGSLNFGYGDPPRDPQKLRAIVEKYALSRGELLDHAKAYESRPPFIIEIAKRRVVSSARLMGIMVERNRVQEELRKYRGQLEELVEERTADLQKSYEQLQMEITERKRAETQLKESEENYRLITENANDLISVLNDRFEIEYANVETHQRILGALAQNKKVSNMAQIHPDDLEKIVTDLKKSFETGDTPPLGTFRLKHTDGHYLWFEARSKLFIGDSGERKLITIAREVTERVIAEQKLKDSEAKYREAYNHAEFYKDLLSHDIGNFLHSISLSTDMSLTNLDDFEKLKEDLKSIREQIESAAKLISNVKVLSELEESSPPLEKIEICPLLTEAINFVRNSFKGQQINIQIRAPDKRLFVQANSLLLNVFENILHNAAKYCQPPISEIFIKVSSIQKDAIPYLQVEFMDNGIGVPDIQKESIFQRAFRKNRSVSGMGIGLSLVKRIIIGYKGKIWVEDKVRGDYSKGSNFIILIPEVL